MSESAEFRFDATVNPDGTLKPVSAAITRARLQRWAGKRVFVTVEKERRRRSNPQNQLLFGPIYEDLLAGLRELALEAGEKCPFKSKESLHDAMKYLFVGPTIIHVPGVGEMETEPHTKTMSTEQFSEFIEKVLKWGAERGIYCRTGFEEWSA